MSELKGVASDMDVDLNQFVDDLQKDAIGNKRSDSFKSLEKGYEDPQVSVVYLNTPTYEGHTFVITPFIDKSNNKFYTPITTHTIVDNREGVGGKKFSYRFLSKEYYTNIDKEQAEVYDTVSAYFKDYKSKVNDYKKCSSQKVVLMYAWITNVIVKGGKDNSSKVTQDLTNKPVLLVLPNSILDAILKAMNNVDDGMRISGDEDELNTWKSRIFTKSEAFASRSGSILISVDKATSGPAARSITVSMNLNRNNKPLTLDADSVNNAIKNYFIDSVTKYLGSQKDIETGDRFSMAKFMYMKKYLTKEISAMSTVPQQSVSPTPQQSVSPTPLSTQHIKSETKEISAVSTVPQQSVLPTPLSTQRIKSETKHSDDLPF